MVAPSYQSFDILTEPYTLNNKTYIKVRNPKTGTERQVRFYKPAEYKKAFPNTQTPEEKITFAASPKADPYYKPQKTVLGFLPPEDSITIFRGDPESHIEFFRSNGAKYTRWWGWYFPSSSLPTTLPIGLEPVILPWASVAADENSLLPDSALAPIIDSFLYPSSSTPPSIPIGTRLDLNITVHKALTIETPYGSKYFYVFRDANAQAQTQEYTWTTSSCSWPEGSTHSIRGTVKDIQLYHGNYQIVLTRCTERK